MKKTKAAGLSGVYVFKHISVFSFRKKLGSIISIANFVQGYVILIRNCSIR